MQTIKTKYMKNLETMEEVLELSKILNGLIPDNVVIDVKINGVNEDDIKKLAIQREENWFEACPINPHFWTSLRIGKVDFIINGKKKKYKLV